MNLIVKNTIRFFFILFIQVFILNKIPPLHQFVVPYFYFIFILWLPFKTQRWVILLVGFLLGFTVDMFYKTPGLHAAASVLIAYLRPFVINLLLPKEATEWGNEEPNRVSMGSLPFTTYVILLTILHNLYLIFLEWMQFGSFFYFLGKLIATSLVSLLLILISELLVNRRKKAR
jgi:rod shape-determining protein MreD